MNGATSRRAFPCAPRPGETRNRNTLSLKCPTLSPRYIGCCIAPKYASEIVWILSPIGRNKSHLVAGTTVNVVIDIKCTTRITGGDTRIVEVCGTGNTTLAAFALVVYVDSAA